MIVQLVHSIAVVNCLEELAAEREAAVCGSFLTDTLRRLGFSTAEADDIARIGVRGLHDAGRLPTQLTLGAWLVLDIVQRCERSGHTDDLTLRRVKGVCDRVFIPHSPATDGLDRGSSGRGGVGQHRSVSTRGLGFTRP
jgi:hypothetical protein